MPKTLDIKNVLRWHVFASEDRNAIISLLSSF